MREIPGGKVPEKSKPENQRDLRRKTPAKKKKNKTNNENRTTTTTKTNAKYHKNNQTKTYPWLSSLSPSMAHGHVPWHFPEMTLVCTPDNRAKFPGRVQRHTGINRNCRLCSLQKREKETEKQTASQLTQELSTPVLGRWEDKLQWWNSTRDLFKILEGGTEKAWKWFSINNWVQRKNT